MIYEIYKDGELVNTIVADESFVNAYCEDNGYTYSEVTHHESTATPEPTIDERIASLEAQLAESDEAAIALFEAQTAQEAIDAEQDEAILELYELVGG